MGDGVASVIAFFFFLTSACNRTFHFGSSKMTFLISAINSSPSPSPPSFTLSSIFFVGFVVLLLPSFFPQFGSQLRKINFFHTA